MTTAFSVSDQGDCRTMEPIALTMGEPAGIGGEIALVAWQRLAAAGPAFFLIDDPARVAALSAQLGLGVEVVPVHTVREAKRAFRRGLPVQSLTQLVPFTLGLPAPTTASAVLEAIRTATALAMAGDVSAIVTNPIHKATLKEAGFDYPGHTEYLAALAGVARTVMMLAGSDLRVVPVTVHIPLGSVAAALTVETIVETARITGAALRRDFAIADPRLAVAGLNPHAGEHGTMGHEDRDVIAPAIAALRREGINAFGPLPADTMFHARARQAYDAALCMYHDQGLIPIKTLAFDEGVNVTLGLPFVRTSPDHGTALDIVGQGIARADSLICAIQLAAEIARRRRMRTAE